MDIARDGFTAQQIKDTLHMVHGTREVRFRYDLLDKNNNFKRTLDNVVGGSVKNNTLSSIHRTASFTMKDDNQINWLSDRIHPFYCVRVKGETKKRIEEQIYFLQPTFPARFREVKSSTDEAWVDFPLGVFILSSPIRQDENYGVYRNVDAYDTTLILKDDKFEARESFYVGQNYVDAVIRVLEDAGITKHNIAPGNEKLPVTKEIEPGTEKLKTINDLLNAINYTPLFVDADGYFSSFPYQNASQRQTEYAYEDNEISVIYNGMSEELDLFDVPNKFVAVLSDPERTPFKSIYVNDNPNSPTSTVNRGRTIVDFREVDDIASQWSLDRYVERLAFDASQVYGKLEFETAIMPFHDHFNVLEIKYSPLNISEKYIETGWSFPLEVGGKMSHSVRRVVSV